MSGVAWSSRFHQAVSTWPCINDLGSAAAQVLLNGNSDLNLPLGKDCCDSG